MSCSAVQTLSADQGPDQASPVVYAQTSDTAASCGWQELNIPSADNVQVGR